MSLSDQIKYFSGTTHSDKRDAAFESWKEFKEFDLARMIKAYRFKQISNESGWDFLEWFFDRAESGNERYMDLRYNLAEREGWEEEADCIAADFLEYIIDNTSAY